MTFDPIRPRRRPSPLSRVLAGAGLPVDTPDVEVTGATLDSRLVQPGDLYLALPGARAHGAQYADQARAAGAVAVLTDPAGAAMAGAAGQVVVVDDPRAVMAEVAAEVYGRPARQLTMLGVTGTNGKTTTALMLAAALRATGRRVGTIGTLGFRLDDDVIEGARTTVTTPDSPELQALLAVMVERGADAVAIEVSSHAMALHRADGIVFDAAGFTNLGRDHLDFHHTLEAYFEAKASLFTAAHTRSAVVNADDAHGRILLQRLATAGEVPAYAVGWESGGRESGGRESTPGGLDHRIVRATARSAGRHDVTLETPRGVIEFVLGLPGDFNVRNAATALAMLDVAGLDARAGAAGLADLQVPGRMQRVDLAGEGAPVAYVDFAHTPDAVAAAVASLAAPRAEGRRLVVVVGCGGDRDASKREPMGAAAATGSDLTVITDDNPRSEDPASIRAAALAGARAAGGAEVVDGGDRRAAIRLALAAATPGGLVLVLGKGHEQGQDINGTITPFDDAGVVVEEWARRRPEGGPQWYR